MASDRRLPKGVKTVEDVASGRGRGSSLIIRKRKQGPTDENVDIRTRRGKQVLKRRVQTKRTQQYNYGNLKEARMQAERVNRKAKADADSPMSKDIKVMKKTKKLPKGAKSLGDVARHRGTGGSILRESKVKPPTSPLTAAGRTNVNRTGRAKQLAYDHLKSEGKRQRSVTNRMEGRIRQVKYPKTPADRIMERARGKGANVSPAQAEFRQTEAGIRGNRASTPKTTAIFRQDVRRGAGMEGMSPKKHDINVKLEGRRNFQPLRHVEAAGRKARGERVVPKGVKGIGQMLGRVGKVGTKMGAMGTLMQAHELAQQKKYQKKKYGRGGHIEM